jgi:hypothetical protein
MENRIRAGLTMNKHPPPDKAALRQFGLMLATILAVIFGAVPMWWLGKPPLDPVMVAVAVLLLWSLLLPKTLKPLYQLWMAIGEVLGWINTRIILGVLFVALFFPVGLLMKLMGKDPMHRRLDRQAASYRKSCHHQPREHLERPY